MVVNARQTPKYSDIRFADDEGGDFLFVPVGVSETVAGQQVASAPAAAPTPTVDREALFWTSIKDSENPADFESYLEQYPYGTFAAFARNRLDATRTPAAPSLDGLWAGEIEAYGGLGLPSRRPFRVIVRDGRLMGRFSFGFFGATFTMRADVEPDGRLRNAELTGMLETFRLHGTLWKGDGSGQMGWQVRYDMEKQDDQLTPELEKEIVEGPSIKSTTIEDSLR